MCETLNKYTDIVSDYRFIIIHRLLEGVRCDAHPFVIPLYDTLYPSSPTLSQL